ncbi:MAG: S49 family peptidase [Legionellales bacterium]|jgi:protease-4
MQDSTQTVWEREVLEKALLASVTEQRRARRWGIFFKLVFLTIILLGFFAACSDKIAHKPLAAHTAVINVEGIINSEFNSAKLVNEGLRAAFEEKQAHGVILKLNSPGGSPVQSNEVFDEINRLRAKYPDKKVYAVIDDVCASGCYYMAVAANEIYANPASLVGSIGVLFDGFGFVDTLNKLGVQRRLLTAGENKAFMDPFSPTTPQMEGYVQDMLNDIHQQFITAVEQGRGDRLKQNDLTFSGLAWTGHQAKDLGLVDNFGSADYVAREVIGAETLIDYTTQANWLDRLSQHMGASFAHAFRSEVYSQQMM